MNENMVGIEKVELEGVEVDRIFYGVAGWYRHDFTEVADRVLVAFGSDLGLTAAKISVDGWPKVFRVVDEVETTTYFFRAAVQDNEGDLFKVTYGNADRDRWVEIYND